MDIAEQISAARTPISRVSRISEVRRIVFLEYLYISLILNEKFVIV